MSQIQIGDTMRTGGAVRVSLTDWLLLILNLKSDCSYSVRPLQSINIRLLIAVVFVTHGCLTA
jgi:hypothetical protein